jgi:hypothetical protein
MGEKASLRADDIQVTPVAVPDQQFYVYDHDPTDPVFAIADSDPTDPVY